jgi:drug/metabolite transporter (DMT)-like permease
MDRVNASSGIRGKHCIDTIVPLVGGGVILLWSGTAIANKIAVAHMDPLTAGITRSMLAGLIAAGVGVAARLPLPDTPARWGLLALSGTACFAVWPMLLSVGLGLTTANHAALVMALLPVLTGLIAFGLERRLPRLRWWIGVAVALAGTFALVFHRSGGTLLSEAGGATGDLIILGGTLVCASGYVAGGRLSGVLGTRATTLWGLAVALTVLVPAFLARAPRTDWSSVGTAGWSAIAYLTLISSLLGYAAWFWALGRGGIARVGSWQLAQPVLTVALAAVLLRERVTFPLALSAATIIAGTAIAQKQAAPPSPPGGDA